MQRMTYREAMERFGIDRPGHALRPGDPDISARSPPRPRSRFFKDALAKGADRPKLQQQARRRQGHPHVPGGAEKLTRKITDGYNEFVKGFGAGGVAVVKVVNATGRARDRHRQVPRAVRPSSSRALNGGGIQPGDTVLFVADVYSVATKAIGELRQKVARDMGLVPKPGAEGGPWNFLWVVDFPMFEKNKDTGKWVAMHHPFTSPRDDQMQAFLDADVQDEVTIECIVSAGYDIVLNGSGDRRRLGPHPRPGARAEARSSSSSA
jgi:aspartyl-tRNA synthetase